jgi:peptidyl-prolyl cis-trans isomerase C
MAKVLAVLVACAMAPAAWAVDLAKVNGKTITDKDLTLALGGLNEGQRDSVLKDPNSRRQILGNLIDQELLIQEGEKAKLDQDQEYKDALAAFRRNYLAARVVDKNIGPKLTERAAKKYYEVHRSRFSTDRAHVQHILLGDEAAAREVLAKAKAPTADFQELAEKLSRDPSARNNRGDLGIVNRDSPFVPEFKEAVFSATSGEITGPVKTSYGYHVIKVVDKKLGKPLEYHEVELKVKGEMRQELMQNYVGQLRTQAKVSVDDKALDKL